MTQTAGRVALGVVILALIVVLQAAKTNRLRRSRREEADHARMPSVIQVVLVLGLTALIAWELLFS